MAIRKALAWSLRLRGLLAVFTLLSISSVYAQVGCQDQVCDLSPPSVNGKITPQCFRCINEGGATCTVADGDCPSGCISTRCGGHVMPFQSKNGFPDCKVVLAQYRTQPIPKPGENHLQMTMWPGTATDPLQLIGVAHDATKDFFSKGEVWNSSPSQDVVEYRIGWLIYPRDGGKPIEREGRLKKFATPLAPDQQTSIPAQGAAPDESADGRHNRIVFYIAEAVLGDGTDWRPDLSAIEKKYNPH